MTREGLATAPEAHARELLLFCVFFRVAPALVDFVDRVLLAVFFAVFFVVFADAPISTFTDRSA